MQYILVPTALILLPNYLAVAAVACEAGFIADNFSNADYGKLGSNSPPPTTGADKLLDGIASENYVFAANSFTTSGALDSGGINTYKSITTGGVQNFEFFQDFKTPETTRTVSYTFKNKFTNNPQALDKLSLTVYDIDSNVSLNPTIFRPRYFEFFDEVTITGFTSAGAPVNPVLNAKGNTITDNAPYRQQSTTSGFSCSDLDNKCKVSVTFDEPIVRVDVVYGNNTDLNYYWQDKYNNPGDQLINIVFDGYCYKPQPRLIYKKELSDLRKVNTDQFTVQIKDNADNSVVTSNITTTTTKGTGNTIITGTGTTGAFKIDPTKTYTLTEAASENTNLANYSDAYVCRRADNSIVTPLDPKNLKLTYGDSWTCTVTNSLKPYTFTGFVFNDNGGIAASEGTRQNISTMFTSNDNYFNGIFNNSGNNIESGIGDTRLQVRLTNCSFNGGKDITGTTAQNISTPAASGMLLGQYRFTVPASVIATLSPQKVCVVQVEPSDWDYNIDTTPNTREVTLVANTFDYKTESNGSRNLDFGEVKANNASLVLIKSQYVHTCNESLSFTSFQNTEDPTTGFSIKPPTTSVDPGKCIAYKIDAYNRGHVDLKDIQISDTLRTKAQGGLVNSVFTMPLPKGIPALLFDGKPLPSGTITSNIFDLKKPTGAVPTQATLYFNTKYRNTTDP